MHIVFCDVSKAFNKVWHEGLLYKLSSIGICGHLLRWFEDYLSKRQQRVLVRGQTSDWGTIEAGVPQGSFSCVFEFVDVTWMLHGCDMHEGYEVVKDIIFTVG